MHYYNGAQRYQQFLQVGQLYRALILLSLALFRAPLCLRSSWCYIRIKFFCLHPSLYLLVSWFWWDWPLTWLTNHHPSVLWHCWLGHLTHKIVSEMTYNVSSGTLNTTILYLQHLKPNAQQKTELNSYVQFSSVSCCALNQWRPTMIRRRRMGSRRRFLSVVRRTRESANQCSVCHWTKTGDELW